MIKLFVILAFPIIFFTFPRNKQGNEYCQWYKLLALDEGESTGEETEPSPNCADVSANFGIWISHCHVQCSMKHTSEHGHLCITVIFGNFYPLTDELLSMKEKRAWDDISLTNMLINCMFQDSLPKERIIFWDFCGIMYCNSITNILP